MRTFFLAFVVFPFLALGQTSNGFKGYKWGTQFSKMMTTFRLLEVDNKSGLKSYSTNISNLGEAKVVVMFYFYKDRFTLVKLSTNTHSDSRAMQLAFQQAYGEGTQVKDGSAWIRGRLGNDSYATYTEEMQEYGVISSAEIMLASISISNEYSADLKKNAQKNAKEF